MCSTELLRATPHPIISIRTDPLLVGKNYEFSRWERLVGSAMVAHFPHWNAELDWRYDAKMSCAQLIIQFRESHKAERYGIAVVVREGCGTTDADLASTLAWFEQARDALPK